MNPADEVQRSMLNSVRTRCHSQRHWMAEIARVLNKSKHSVYKKYQGEVCLSLQEILTLARHYHLRLDPLIVPGMPMTLDFHDLGSPEHPVAVLEHMHLQLRTAARLPDVSLKYACRDLPMVCILLFPEIAAFRCYFRSLTCADHIRKFSFNEYLSQRSFHDLLAGGLGCYSHIPSTEYWSDLIYSPILTQIRYTLEQGLFRKAEEALRLCTILLDSLSCLEDMAGRRNKTGPVHRMSTATFDLYHGEGAISNDVLLFESRDQGTIFLHFGSPHVMTSTDPGIMQSYKKWFDGIHSQSQSLTLNARKSRVRYFSALKQRVRHAREEMESIIKINCL